MKTEHETAVEDFFNNSHKFLNEDSILVENLKFQVYFFNNLHCKFNIDTQCTLSQINRITKGLGYKGYKVDVDKSEAFEMKYHFINTKKSECAFVLIIKKPNSMSPRDFYSLCKNKIDLSGGFNTQDE